VIRNKAIDALKAAPDPATRSKILRALENAFECFGEDYMSVEPPLEEAHAERVKTAYDLATAAMIDWGMVGDELEPPHSY
jgi:hypothetical protein